MSSFGGYETHGLAIDADKENMSNPKLIAQLSKDAGATVGATLYSDALSAADKPGATYLKMMNHNLTQLVAGMKLN